MTAPCPLCGETTFCRCTRGNSEVASCDHCGGAFRRDKRARRLFCSLTCKFWSQVKVAGQDDCWEWQGRLNAGGYGVGIAWTSSRRSRLAHRQAWELQRGSVPDGLFVLHSCDNRGCCNPKHHFLGTKAENNFDMYAKGRDCHSRGTFRRDTRARGEGHPRAKLTADQVQQIRSSSLSHAAAGRAFGVHRVTIYRIREGARWS